LTLYDMATPSLTTSAMISFMEPKHRHGLRSGGLVGYSTFFTGYDPSRGHSFARQVSLGRMGAKGVEMAAKGLMATPLGSSEAARYIAPFARAGKYGIAGAVDAAVRGPGADLGEEAVETAAGAVNPQQLSMGFGQSATPDAGEQLSMFGDGGKPKSKKTVVGPYSDWPRGSQSVDDVVEEGAEAATKTTSSSAGQRIRKWLYGVFGGTGFKEGGTKAAFRETSEEIAGMSFKMAAPEAGTGGALAASGSLGKWAGRALRGAGWFEVARMGVQAGSYAVNSAYESMVETTARLQQRVGHQQQMSPAYYNRAAATERQRAARELNESVLNPRTQLKGNEAAFYHR